jgi:hypothetical protein
VDASSIGTTKEDYFQGIIGTDPQDGTFVNLVGPNLRTELTSRLEDTYSRVNYQKCGYVALEEIDESKNDKDSITAFYSRAELKKDKCSKGKNTPDYWNKEHIYPKSRWGGNTNDAYSDLHHLVAADQSVNTDRGRNDFKAGENFVTDKDFLEAILNQTSLNAQNAKRQKENTGSQPQGKKDKWQECCSTWTFDMIQKTSISNLSMLIMDQTKKHRIKMMHMNLEI